MIQHFILTRSDYSDHELGHRRWKLTEKYLIPSLLRQTRKDWQWVTTGMGRDATGWGAIEQFIHPDMTHILTTRVDDDDSLTLTFIERLRECVVEGPATVYTFPCGHVESEHGELSPRTYQHNQFQSLLCPIEDRLTVYCDQHTHLHKRFPVVEVDRQPAWCWHCHADQLSRRQKSCRR
jgi:hypothetical protein